MRHAVERGINWIDTAAVYGLGHSEEVVGRLLKMLPRAERPLVFTKCGLVWDDQTVVATHVHPISRSRISPPISRCATACGRSPNVIGPRWLRSRWHGR